MALRSRQAQAYAAEDLSRDGQMRSFFGLPADEDALIELNAVLSKSPLPSALTKPVELDSYSGKLVLTAHFLCFCSNDRRSARLSLPLYTIRRVEKLLPGAAHARIAPGVYALVLELWDGDKIVLQLHGLRPTCDAFASHLRTQLRAAVPLMKSIKPLLHTFYSEILLSEPTSAVTNGKGKERERDDEGLLPKSTLIDAESAPDFTTRGSLNAGWHGGLGLVYKFPGDPRKRVVAVRATRRLTRARLRERSKMRLWTEYFSAHGRNLTLLRYPTFARLIQVGLPNRLRGELWEVCSGSIHLRAQHPGEYARILEANEGKTSLSTEEIEKDLNRSLPEYPAYQTPEGIEALRRVLTAFSWYQPDVGYCQGLNLIVSAFLIYTSEEQCFWLLSVLCDRLLPGYYSPSMYGTLLDQKVFEHLVQRCLPMLHEHFLSVDVQLSVASLPWFMSLFISTMPLVFAFRLVDCFFHMGPKVLFQVGLAILRINGEELLSTTDDGAFINVLKNYFNTLGESAHPRSDDPRLRQVTRFQVLLVTAFREFGIITDDTITSERKRFRGDVVDSIETFVKRTAIRNLAFAGRLSKAQLGDLHDTFQLAVHKARAAAVGSDARKRKAFAPAIYRDAQGRPEVRIDRAAFPWLLAELASWAREERIVKNAVFHERAIRELGPEHDFVQRVFSLWDVGCRGSLSFQDVVTGMDGVLFNDLMANVSWMFSVHDANADGYLSKDEVLQLSESLLYIFRNEPGDNYLAAVSGLLQNAFEFAESIAQAESDESASSPVDGGRPRANSVVEVNPHRPYVSLASFRMVVLADETLEGFFESDLTQSWRIEEQVHEPAPARSGLFGGLVTALMTDENKERLNRLADEVGKRLDLQTIEQRPAIGKADATASIAREPMMMTRSTSGSSPLSAASMRQPPPGLSPRVPTELGSPAPSTAVPPSTPAMIQRATSELPERPRFALDEAVPEGEGDEDEDEAAPVRSASGSLMDDVDAFLEANDDSAPGRDKAASATTQAIIAAPSETLVDL